MAYGLKNKDLTKIKEHWDDPCTVSLKDKNLQLLERAYILKALQKIGRVSCLADVGCGDGEDTIYWRNSAKKVFGYDYSLSMLKKAKDIVRKKVALTRFDLIEEAFDRSFDVIVTKRCLINLGNFRNQKEAILKIRNSLNKGGYYLMLECSLQGLNNINSYRDKMNLGLLKEPFHNSYFDLKKLLPFIEELFHIKEARSFSSYYFLTRLFSQLCDVSDYNKMDGVARDIQLNTDILSNEYIGPQFFMVLKRK